MSDEKMVQLVGKAIGNGLVEVTAEEFRRVAEMPLVAEIQTVGKERGDSFRGLCGVRVSMGGLRLSKPITIRATDSFVFSHRPLDEKLMASLSKDALAAVGKSDTFKAVPEDLVPVSINGEGRVHEHDNYHQSLFGFKVPKAVADHSVLILQHDHYYGTSVSTFFLGDVQDAMVEDDDDKADFKWVVLEPLVVPSPKSRFPSSDGK